jgi:hypothetical protein
MSELHWTGAAVLLSLAVLGNGSLRRRRAHDAQEMNFDAEDALDTRAHAATHEPCRLAAVRVSAERPASASRRRAS